MFAFDFLSLSPFLKCHIVLGNRSSSCLFSQKGSKSIKITNDESKTTFNTDIAPRSVEQLKNKLPST